MGQDFDKPPTYPQLGWSIINDHPQSLCGCQGLQTHHSGHESTKMKNSVLSGLTARGPGRSHPFHHLPQPLHVRWLLPQDPRSPEITAGMLEGIPLITVLHHSSMDSMDFRALPLDSLFATAEPADEAAKLSSTGPSL